MKLAKTRRYGYFITKKRVIEGLKRAAQSIWGGEIARLPTSSTTYEKEASKREPNQRTHRLYPSQTSVLEFFSSMNEAWWAAGYEVETVVRKVGFRAITPEVHAKLEYIYRFQGLKKSERPADAPTVRAYADEVGVQHHVLCKYASSQGWVIAKEPVWSRVELRLLEKYAHLSPTIIQKHFDAAGFHRTETAIRLMRKRRNAHKGAPYYSATAVCRLIGLDGHKFDRDWLLKFPGELKYEMKGTAKRGKQHADTKLFHIDTLREFFLNHPEEIDLSKVDKIWFLWLVTNGRVKMVAPSERLSKRVEGYQPEMVKEHRNFKRPGRAPKQRAAHA
jgi:hypothetical protein